MSRNMFGGNIHIPDGPIYKQKTHIYVTDGWARFANFTISPNELPPNATQVHGGAVCTLPPVTVAIRIGSLHA